MIAAESSQLPVVLLMFGVVSVIKLRSSPVDVWDDSD